jgi:hypothetical protein
MIDPASTVAHSRLDRVGRALVIAGALVLGPLAVGPARQAKPARVLLGRAGGVVGDLAAHVAHHVARDVGRA